MFTKRLCFRCLKYSVFSFAFNPKIAATFSAQISVFCKVAQSQTFIFVDYRVSSRSQAEATACRMSQRATTCSSLQPIRLRTWSCSGVRVCLRMLMCKNRLKLIFRMPRLPSTMKTSAASRKENGWLLLSASTARCYMRILVHIVFAQL